MDRFAGSFPGTKFLFGIIEDLSSGILMLIRPTRITRDNRSVIKTVEQTASMARKDDLLFRPLNYSRQMNVISLLELCSRLGSKS